MDNGLQTDVVFMDIAKAFDTVDYSKMLQKIAPLIPSYTLDGKQLTLFNTEMDLGVDLNSNLTWVNQENSVRYKANKMLGFIRRSTKEIHDVRARKSLYSQLVRNNFAFASQVWSPQTI